ncbi:DUF2502 domain-containing protein [Escherichia marmotae]|uniref:DUF2502 domain-containing protein n=1 Tax=Escherichia TaxID=561 RepID=UPI000CF742C9|nr:MULTISPECIES: DUF2502 domain-containing protein [Escherichia]MBA7741014.1 DUF2502 domain-containing protein [Escherichia marmotae]MBA7954891.1 DUF2502 domain-containing protein [Escherichia marmotae]MBY7305742.1 DUF2502 domain-containing protein [Escherichia marmotae]MBY7378729.1 DUF2502 domain-containing protein [Escherichia marmotae]MBY7387844.1 DUF2502 domain-containing protein [Escherichia marmotae]
MKKMQSILLALSLILVAPMAAQAEEIMLVPSVKLQIGDRDHRGYYWDGGYWRDHNWWYRNYEWRDNRWHPHGSQPHHNWYNDHRNDHRGDHRNDHGGEHRPGPDRHHR